MGEPKRGSEKKWRTESGAGGAAGVTALAFCAMVLCVAVSQARFAALDALPAPPPAQSRGQEAGSASGGPQYRRGWRSWTRCPASAPARAQAILDYREEHGPFRYVEELVYVDGIGEGILADLMDLVTVGDPRA